MDMLSIKSLYFFKFFSSSGENNGGMRSSDMGVGDGGSWSLGEG